MKKLLRVLAYALALNFLAVAGGTAYLWRTGHLDRGRAGTIKAILFPPDAALAPVSLAKGGGDATTQPSMQLDDLLQKAAGRSAEEKVEFLQRSFDARMAQLDLRERELANQQRQIDFASQRLASDRAALETDKKNWAQAQQQAALQANDQGFQDSLQLYSVMIPKQVKTIFMTLSEPTVERYLEAMPPRTAGKIIKEFKTPDETDRIQKVLERMRLRNAPQTQPSPADGQTAAAPTGP